jgi:hypothetical protein
MPNHYHLILTVPNPNFDLGYLMSLFQCTVTKRTNFRAGKSGHLFGGPYHWSAIMTSRYYYHALKYVYRNPVKARICERVEHYEFSTFTGLFGGVSLPFPIHYTRSGMEVHFPSEEPSGWVDWLNRPFGVEMEERIRSGLKKKVFGPTRNRKTRKFDQSLDLDS